MRHLVDLITDETLIRILLAILLGGSIGLERELHGRAAGFRTHILVCLGATIITLASTKLYPGFASLTSNNVVRIDPGRIAAGIVTGIGFLGAGVILRSEKAVRGLTTAASIWFIAGLGIVIGLGLYRLSFEATVFALATLFLLRKTESYIRQDWYATVKVKANRKEDLLGEIVRICQEHDLTVKGYEIEEDIQNDIVTITLDVRFKRRQYTGQELVSDLSRRSGVRQVQWS
ncbi:TPA: MgtC/SapB family protein [Candidatus Poribacteria bacterium]|nr:MgtC/SapB family protein [Candidatus Poribacteria bacterium]